MRIREEYPRPDFDRSHCWESLNGKWKFAPDPTHQGLLSHWEQPGTILWSQSIQVPFAWETALSEVRQEWLPAGWYRHFIQRPVAWTEEQTILHFGAVHYHCQVWINGQWVGEHTGGYVPFSFDITDVLLDGQGELIVYVEAPLDKLAIPHGKQRSRPADGYDDCAFTASSGIWQSVWLEGRPATFIQQVDLEPGSQLDSIAAQIYLQGKHLADATLAVAIDGMPEQIVPIQGATALSLIWPVKHPQTWTPRHPHLYYVRLRLESPDGIDYVTSYTGLRRIEVRGNRLVLNGEQLYLRGALDQGYWPESGYTAPTDDALRLDVELALKAGFNLIRKHIKLEDPRWLFWADRLGLLVWAEPPCVGRYSSVAIRRFEEQLPLMVARDRNHPSIILWGIYNEEWGLDWRTVQDVEKQEAVARAYDLLAAHDHSRPIIDDLGWNHVKTDVLDWHYYDEDNRRWREVTNALVSDPNTWFGHQLAVDRWYETQLNVADAQHQQMPLMNGEYGVGATPAERGWYFCWQTQELRRQEAINGYIYTELYDVEHELCGIYDAQRQLKPLGCDPAQVNAETVIIFDLLPKSPDLDYVVAQREFQITLCLSHQGPRLLRGKLIWGWENDMTNGGDLPLELEPYTITENFPITLSLPASQSTGKLHVQFIDESNQCYAHSFVHVGMKESTR